MQMKKFIFVLLAAILLAVTLCAYQGGAQTKAEAGRDSSKMVVKITAGRHVLKAKLDDSAASRALWGKLPLTLPMSNLYGREMCFHFGPGGLPANEAKDQGYKVGDLSYWPPRGSLVILYKQNGEVFNHQTLGHINGDVSFFDKMDEADVTFEKAS